jgi:hypothetical protein
MRRASSWFSLLLATALVGTGCSGGPKLVPVTGKVTLNGAPLKNVKVEFHPDPDKGVSGPSSSGTTDADGNFTLVCTERGNAPGAVVGSHRVVITDLDLYGDVFVGRGDYRSEDPKGPKEVPKFPRFAAHYSTLSATPFKQEVTAGMSPVTFDVKK